MRKNTNSRKPVLTLMIGLPYSGKTTWAVEHANAPIVCPDAIRLALHGQRFAPAAEPMVWAMARYMVLALFGAEHQHVILDATNATEERRLAWLDSSWTVEYKVIPTPADVCIERARAVGDEEIVPVIERMARNWDIEGELA